MGKAGRNANASERRIERAGKISMPERLLSDRVSRFSNLAPLEGTDEESTPSSAVTAKRSGKSGPVKVDGR